MVRLVLLFSEDSIGNKIANLFIYPGKKIQGKDFFLCCSEAFVVYSWDMNTTGDIDLSDMSYFDDKILKDVEFHTKDSSTDKFKIVFNYIMMKWDWDSKFYILHTLNIYKDPSLKLIKENAYNYEFLIIDKGTKGVFIYTIRDKRKLCDAHIYNGYGTDISNKLKSTNTYNLI